MRCRKYSKGRDRQHQCAKYHTTHTHLHTKLTFSLGTTHITPCLHTHTLHFEDISRDERLICGLIPGRAWFKMLLMVGLIVCQLPGCQIRHVGSQPGFSSPPFMFAHFIFFLQSLQNWIATLPLKKSPARHTTVIGPVCKLLAPLDWGLVCGKYSGYYTPFNFACDGLHLQWAIVRTALSDSICKMFYLLFF